MADLPPSTPLPPTMRAATYLRPHEVEVLDVPVPAAGPEDVLVEVSHCGICGSDLHTVIDGWGPPDSIGGHEWSGRVVAVGDAVGGWSPGDLVVGGPNPTCGTCVPCRDGRPSLCEDRNSPGVDHYQGAFADYIRAHGEAVIRVPERLSLRHAAYAEPLAVALHAITRSAIESGQRAMVLGAGPIGAAVVAVLAQRGHEVVVSEPAPARAALAAAVGATRVVHPDDLEVPAMPNDLVTDPVDVVYECSGKGRAVVAGLAQLRRAGTFVVVGAGMDFPRLDTNRVLMNELVVTGAYCYDAGGFDDALALMASGVLPLDRLIERADVGLDGLLEAIEGLARGEIAGKVLVAPATDA